MCRIISHSQLAGSIPLYYLTGFSATNFRFLYDGITEEILMRFGLMTFLVWLVSKIIKKTNDASYCAGILISSLLFAVGHFPVAFQAVNNPSADLLSYILIGNSVGGFIFGWLFWEKGLEASFVAP